MVVWSALGWLLTKVLAKLQKVFQGELAMVGGEVLQVIRWELQVQRDVCVPTTGGAFEAWKGQDGPETGGLHMGRPAGS